MRRADVIAARAAAQRFVELTDELLAEKQRTYDFETKAYVEQEWSETAWIAGRLTGAHRRASLDLTRALSWMRRRR